LEQNGERHRSGRNPRTVRNVEVEEKHIPFFKTGSAKAILLLARLFDASLCPFAAYT